MKALLQWLLGAALPGWARESVLGDLDEEFHRVAERRGTAAARWWYAREAVRLGLWYGKERWRPAPATTLGREPARSLSRGLSALARDFLWDTRIAVRQIGRRPWFSIAAIVPLAVAIGANAAFFSLVNAVLLKPLARHEPERVVRLQWQTDHRGPLSSFAYSDYRLLAPGQDTLTDVAAVHLAAVGTVFRNTPDQILAEVASASYFRLLGVRVVAGASITPDDDRAASQPVVLIAERYWRHRLGGDPSVIGNRIALNGRAYTVVGVVEETFGGSFIGAPVDAWVPLEPSLSLVGTGLETSRSRRVFQMLGRLRPGVASSHVRDRLAGLSTEMARTETEPGFRLDAAPGTLLHGRARGQAKLFLSVITALVGLILLIASSNVANLLLSRALTRRRETAVQVSLGAGPGRIVRQLCAESLVLAVCGGAAGLLLAGWLTASFSAVRLLPGLELRLQLSPDWRVLWFTAAMAILAGLVATIGPALSVIRRDLRPNLQEGSGSAGSLRTGRLRRALVVLQVAVVAVACVAAGLLTRSGRAAAAIDPGFKIDGTFATDIDLKVHGYDESRGRAFYRELLPRIASLPGVTAVAIATRAPLDSSTPLLRVTHAHDTESTNSPMGAGFESTYTVASPGLFGTIRVPLLAGRDFDSRDLPGGPLVAVINERLAQRLWPEDPATTVVGRRFRIVPGSSSLIAPGGAEVIGVARNARYRTVGEEPQAHVYVPFEQHYAGGMALLVRSASAKMPTTETQAVLMRLDPAVQGFFTRTLEEHTSVALIPARFAARISAIVGLIAGLLGAIGLYGLIACTVIERTKEFGIYLALGASPNAVARGVLRQGMTLAATGVALGLSMALVAAKALTSLLYGVSPADPVIYLAVALSIGLVAAASSWIPARRVTRIGPIQAMRE